MTFEKETRTVAKKKGPSIDLAAFDKPGRTVVTTPLHEEIETSFLEYSYSVIYSRALPDVRDGLKPVQRRILFGMHIGGHRPDRPFVKSARIVGDVMGRFHPHGDGAIYDAMVRVAQPFSLNAPLVTGQGNMGSPDDSPAAMRYTEAKMSPVGALLTGGLDEETVDFRLNFSGDEFEPDVLPAAFPNLLVNGSAGIAVGMATNMIPHNLAEVVAAARWLVTHPNASLDKIMEFVPGPDLPTGALLLGMDQVREAYETGRGTVRMRARVEIGPVEGSRGRQGITATELPYGVGPEKVITKIKEMVSAGKLVGIADVKDLTDMTTEGTRLVIEAKTGVNIQALLSDLYRLTPLEDSFGINNTVLVDGEPKVLGLKALLEEFLRFRYEVVLRRSRFRRSKREDRLHLVEGLLLALLDIDAVIALIRGSENAAAAKAGLMERFALSEVQAAYILDTPLRRLTKYDALEFETEAERLRAEIAELTQIIEDDSVLRKVVARELEQVAKDHAAPRRTTLVDGDLAAVLEASKPAGPLEVTDDPCEVLLSATGLIARTAGASESAEEKRAVNGRVKHDGLLAVVPSTVRGQVLVVTSRARAFKVDTLGLPVLPKRAGTVSLSGTMPVSEVVALLPGERVVALAPVAAVDADAEVAAAAAGVGLALGTRRGVVKVAKPEWPRRADEFTVMGLGEDDEVVAAVWLRDTAADLVFVTSDASLLRFGADKVRPQGLSGGGMAGVKVAEGAEVVSFGAVRSDGATLGGGAGVGEAMVVVSSGAGVKVTPFSEFPAKGRATGGVRCMRFLKTRGAGEERLAVAWVGVDPVAMTRTGDPVELPAVDHRRDGSGETMFGPDVVAAGVRHQPKG